MITFKQFLTESKKMRIGRVLLSAFMDATEERMNAFMAKYGDSLEKLVTDLELEPAFQNQCINVSTYAAYNGNPDKRLINLMMYMPNGMTGREVKDWSRIATVAAKHTFGVQPKKVSFRTKNRAYYDSAEEFASNLSSRKSRPDSTNGDSLTIDVEVPVW